ncbi:MAG: acetyl-CoA carboxylase biotin carboxylase subunit, partial [Chloroflexi bacterium]|nr:acetyl-CoA carboxylase biotin carboxylase subunit [Chloroflexota bacterium]
FNKILIASRGGIAVRVMRACREMGIATVGVYSEVDSEALHTRMADEAVLIGKAEAGESYLNIEKLVVAAKETGAEAVHPGYGFLAENAAFAEAVAAAGLMFIGPKPEAIRAMGDKAAARTLMEQAGVPVVPGYQSEDDDASLTKAAEKVGYPLLVKAAAGGGGKGMRVAKSSGELEEAIAAARREAQNAFGDGRLILEKYVANARHIEFQILSDGYGNTVHLFERECSIQRRHQKVIEETPSPLLDDELRAEMGAAAVAAAQAVDYVNAGTVEFIVDAGTRQYYFLEMNTRLQVEHPITEMITGLDIVQWQIRIAAGEELPFKQDDLQPRGHAIECRLYAEDPANNFLPDTGELLRYREPQGPGMRVDSGVYPGAQVTVHYDPLLAKVVVHAQERGAAIRKMQMALRDTVVLGVSTNQAFLLDVLAHAEFQQGIATTALIDEHFGEWGLEQVSAEVLIAAAIVEIEGAAAKGNIEGLAAEDDPNSPWGRKSGFRMGGGA